MHVMTPVTTCNSQSLHFVSSLTQNAITQNVIHCTYSHSIELTVLYLNKIYVRNYHILLQFQRRMK